MQEGQEEGPGPAVGRQRDQSDALVSLCADALDLLFQAKCLLEEALLRLAG